MKSFLRNSLLFLPLIVTASRRIVTMSSSNNHVLVLDAFGKRQFNNPDYTGTQINFSEVEFEKLVNEAYTDKASLVDGYAPFW
jgi:hypothetical protein